MGYNNVSSITPQAFANISASGVTDVRESRVQEKKDMQDLNERFASYIEKVRFLEAQNRRLADELDKLKQKWGQETSAIKAMYQTELEESRKLLDESEKEKARLEIKCSSLEEKIDELRAELVALKTPSDYINFKDFKITLFDMYYICSLIRTINLHVYYDV